MLDNENFSDNQLRSPEELPSYTQDYIKQHIGQKNGSFFTAGILILGLVGYYDVYSLATNSIESPELMLSCSIVMITIAVLLMSMGQKKNQNLLALNYQWRYGVVTGKHIAPRKHRSRFLIHVDGEQYEAVSYQDYKAARTGNPAIVILFPDSDNKYTRYALIADIRKE